MHDEQNKHTFIDGQNQQDAASQLTPFSTIELIEEIHTRCYAQGMHMMNDGADDAADVIVMIGRLQIGRPQTDHRLGDHRLGDLRLGDHRWGDPQITHRLLQSPVR
eukprot:3608076-Karenia_brevis.AAC.1